MAVTGAGMGSEDSEVDSRAQRRVGTVLRGKYRLDRVLGVGGMAIVYVATHRNQKQFAVKMLHPELSVLRDVAARFLREGYVANSVKHPGAVAVLDDDVAEDGAAFLVMELLEGSAVDGLWEKAGWRLPARAVLAIGYQLLDVLVAAHAKAIVHRDIKPANVFLTRDGTLKVLDFGIARLRDAAGGAHATNTGMLLGTPAFMAPEQALAKATEIDGQTDLWAVGATLFTLLSGRAVHDGETASEVLVHAATKRAPELRSVLPEADARIAQLVDGALAFEKHARWGSAVAMRDTLADMYLAMYGEAVTRAPLMDLFSERGAARASASPPSAPLAPTRDSSGGGSRRARLGLARAQVGPRHVRSRRRSTPLSRACRRTPTPWGWFASAAGRPVRRSRARRTTHPSPPQRARDRTRSRS